MKQYFKFHKLNNEGQIKALRIAELFDTLLCDLEVICPEGRVFAISITKLEEACFFAKKAMAFQKENQE